MGRNDHGRALLQQWEAAKPTNFFDDDRYLQFALHRRMVCDQLSRALPALHQAGRKMHTALLTAAQDLLLGVRESTLSSARDRALTILDQLRAGVEAVLRLDAEVAGFHIRGQVGRMARLFQISLLLDDAEHVTDDESGWLPAAAELLMNRYLTVGYDPMDDPRYPDHIRRLLERP